MLLNEPITRMSISKEKARKLLKKKGGIKSWEATAPLPPLHVAYMWGARKIAQMLLDAGADLNMEGNTPLHHACFWGDVEKVKALLAAGADANAANDRGVTPLMVIKGSQRVEIARLLIAAGADVNPSINAETRS